MHKHEVTQCYLPSSCFVTDNEDLWNIARVIKQSSNWGSNRFISVEHKSLHSCMVDEEQKTLLKMSVWF